MLPRFAPALHRVSTVIHGVFHGSGAVCRASRGRGLWHGGHSRACIGRKGRCRGLHWGLLWVSVMRLYVGCGTVEKHQASDCRHSNYFQLPYASWPSPDAVASAPGDARAISAPVVTCHGSQGNPWRRRSWQGLPGGFFRAGAASRRSSGPSRVETVPHSVPRWTGLL